MVEIETWCQSEGRIGTRRDWIIKDFATDEVIGRATRCIYICFLSFILFILAIIIKQLKFPGKVK